MTQSIPRATDLANLVQAAPRNTLAQRSGYDSASEQGQKRMFDA
jgi:hypothetical protein